MLGTNAQPSPIGPLCQRARTEVEDLNRNGMPRPAFRDPVTPSVPPSRGGCAHAVTCAWLVP